MYVEHPFLKKNKIEARNYQVNIAEVAKAKNTLCVLGTGLGKTNIAIMVAAHRLKTIDRSKVMIMAPTRPLCAQHQKTFQETFNDIEFPEDSILLVTGKITPNQRAKMYKIGDIICATPQTIQNDIKRGIIDFSDFSLLVVDEVHRAVKKYAYPAVAKVYMKESDNPKILGLTASPGSSKEAIDTICKNLYVEAVEIKTEEDEDVAPYVKELDVEWVNVELPEKMKEMRKIIKGYLFETLGKVRKYNLNIKSKTDLLEAQKRISKYMQKNKNPVYFHIISTLAEAMKVWHALELFETQSLYATGIYFDKLEKQTSKSAKRVVKDPKMQKVISDINNLSKKGIEHPKIYKIKELVQENLDKKIIIFSHYRDNIDMIKRDLEKVKGCKPVILIGQSGEKGLSQKEQIQVIEDLQNNIYNCLITTSIGEEGLDIGKLDLAIFYEPVSSEIRTIQRRGRVGRTKIGKAIFLLTKDTRDEAYYWTSQRKEKKMKQILRDMQNKDLNQKNLFSFK